MVTYSIKDIEKITGIRAATLRAWEQRYDDLLCPSRTETNIRYYGDCDLKVLLDIAVLNQNGHRIGCIAKMSEAKRIALIYNMKNGICPYSLQKNRLVRAMIDMDEALFNDIMKISVAQFGFEQTMRRIVCPFLHKVGLLWQTGGLSPAREHFITHLIRRKIMVAIDSQTLQKTVQSKRYLLFLPEGEQHENPLLFANYLLRARGHHVIYLGTNVVFEEVLAAVDYTQPDFLYTICTSKPCKGSIESYIEQLSTNLSDKTILLSGHKIQCCAGKFPLPDNVRMLNNMEEAIEFMEADYQKV